MADSEKLELDITAKDSASKVIDPLQKKVDQLEKAEPEIAVAADTKAASKSIDAITTDAKGLDKLNPEVAVSADTKGAGSDVDTFVRKLSKLSDADQIVTLALRAGAAQTELSQLMTDVAQLEADDPTIDVKLDRVTELTGQLDDLKSKMQSIADTSLDPDVQGKATGRLKDLEAGAGKAGDAVHSMAGNAVGDFAATASGVGPLGEALGQMTEAALGGEASLKQLAAAGLGMGALSGAMLLINGLLGTFAKDAADAAKIKAFNADNAKVYADAVEHNTSLLDAFIDKVRTVGGVKVAPTINEQTAAFEALGDALPTGQVTLFTKGIQDVGPQLLAANSNAKEFYAAALHGGDAVETFTAKVRASGLSVTDQAALLAALNYQIDQNTASAKANATTTALTSDATGGLTEQTQELANAAIHADDAIAEQKKSTDDIAESLKRAKDAAEATKKANQEYADQLRAAADANFNAADKADAYADSLKNVAEKEADGTTSTEDLGRAYRDNTRSAADLADAQVRQRTETDKASGAVTSATTKQDIFNDSMLASAQSATPQARQAILDYIGSVNGIPPEKITEIQAMIDAGDLAGARKSLDDASKARTATINVDANSTDVQRVDGILADLSKDRSVLIRVGVKGGPAKFDSGGKVGPQGGIGGEAGRELAELGGRTVLLEGPTLLPPGTKVTSTARTRTILSRRIPRYANGTGSPAELPSFTGRPLIFNYHQHAAVYGVADLNAHFDAWGRKIAATITAGRR